MIYWGFAHFPCVTQTGLIELSSKSEKLIPHEESKQYNLLHFIITSCRLKVQQEKYV